MVDQEIRVLGDENIITNPKNSQKQYPLTFKAVSNVIVYGRKKENLNFTVPIAEGTNFNFNLERTAIIFSDSFNLEEYSYIMVKNPFEEISDFFYVSSLEELDPTGKEFNEFNDEVVKWLRRLVNIISNRCMIFETTLFKDLNNFPNIKSGQTFLRTDDGWTGITIRDINSELDVIFNKYVEEINKKIKEHETKMNEFLEQWKKDIQKYAENVKQYEIVRVVTQSGHGFVFEPVMYSISQRKFVKAVFPHGADGIAVRVDDNNFRLVWAGKVEIPSTAKDTQQRDFVLGEYYFLGEGSNGGIQREKPDTYYQHLFQIMYSDELQQNIADVLLSVPINQKGKRWDVGEAKTTVNDIEELKMSDFPVGKVVEVLGYYSVGDGADHKRIISSTDDGSGVQLANGLWANILHEGKIYLTWFGAKDDINYNSTPQVEKFFGYMKTNPYCNFIVPTGTFAWEGRVYIPSNIILTIDGTLTTFSGTGIMIEFYDRITSTPKYSGVHDVVINGYGIIDERGDVFSNNRATPLRVHHCKNILIENITMKNNSVFHFIECGGTDGLTVRNVKFKGQFTSLSEPMETNSIECIQFETISEGGTGGAIPYDSTPTKNVIIEECYFGKSETGDMYAAIGEHNPSAQKIFENIVIRNNVFDGINAIAQRTDSVINFTSEFKNLILENNIFKDFKGSCLKAVKLTNSKIYGNTILNEISNENNVIFTIETSETVTVSNNFVDDVSSCFLYLSQSNNVNIYDNVLKNLCRLNEINKNYGQIGIFLKNEGKNITISNNTFYSNSNYFNKPIHIVFANIPKFINLNIKDNIYFLNVFDLDNFSRYMETNEDVLYEGGVYYGTFNFKYPINYYNEIDIFYKGIETNAKRVKLWHKNNEEPILNFPILIRDFNMSDGDGSINFQEVQLTISEDYNSGNIVTNLSSDTGKFTKKTDNTENNQFLKIVKIVGYGVNRVCFNSIETKIRAMANLKPEMEKENVCNDYLTYLNELESYNNYQHEQEKQKQLVYEEALKENPELTYEEFMSVQPMMLNLVEEPQPSEALKKFMDKYL